MLQITIHARDDKRYELLRTCQLIADKALHIIGCKLSHLSQDSDSENIIILEQQWEQLSFLNDFFRSDHFSALLGAMKWLGRSYEFSINGSTHAEGIEIVNRARNKAR
jgi:quinol monooxygenase YgiN